MCLAPSWRSEPKDVVAVTGHSVVVDCQAEGEPPPHIRWKTASGDAAELPTRADAFRRLREYRLKASARATIAPPAFPHSLRPGSTQRRPALWPHRLRTDLPDALDEAVGSPPSTLLPDTIDDLD
ncbi:hypothetical protein HPB51_002059 [Rhipicephalus microplus]|uniref:Ig-like domain-containing protein n=1 Tax=Rhipicephalus microplus TaxID=6941 RepID=A0A9J6DSE6_RHIMP|nr:hypothetical protein HPB51_002059 [Rhipicephalus microplus]